MDTPGHLLIRRQHAVMHWRELPRSVFTLVVLSGALLLLQMLWRPLGWLVILGNLIFVVPMLLKCGIAALGFPFLLLSGNLQPDERRWGFLIIAAFLVHTALELGWLAWAVPRLLKLG